MFWRGVLFVLLFPVSLLALLPWRRWVGESGA